MYCFYFFLVIFKKINLYVIEIDERVSNFFFISNFCLFGEIFRNEKRFFMDIFLN